MTNLPGRLPAITEHRWPDPDSGPWRVELAWRTVDGRPECRRVIIDPMDDATVVTATVLRNVPISKWIAEDRAVLAPPGSGTGLRQSTLDRLAEAARVYREALTDGQPPTKTVAAHFDLSHGGASNLISRARAAGLLPPTSPGVSAG